VKARGGRASRRSATTLEKMQQERRERRVAIPTEEVGVLGHGDSRGGEAMPVFGCGDESEQRKERAAHGAREDTRRAELGIDPCPQLAERPGPVDDRETLEACGRHVVIRLSLEVTDEGIARELSRPRA